MSAPSPNPFADPPPNPYAPPQAGGPFAPSPGAEPFAPCPGCGNTYASRVGYTLWGGAVGPKMFTHVKCLKCGQAYNGKTGQWNTRNIALYVAVTTGIGGAVLAAIFGARFLS
ncbi:MAG: hypothetical protein WD872_10810 [Pirellulaceae bacterium]